MRRLLGWIGGLFSGLMAYRLWKGWRKPAPVPAPAPVAEEPDARADELRAKLAEARASEEPGPAAPEDAPPASVDDRRRQVHEEGRAAIDRMNDA